MNATASSLLQQAFPPSLIAEKKAIRKQMRSIRRQQDPRVAAYKSRRIASRIDEIGALADAQVFAVYASMADEVDTLPIVRQLRDEQKVIAYPRVEEDGLTLWRVENPETDLTVKGRFGIREPEVSRCQPIDVQEIDVFLAPGIAFDLMGSRVGFGGGYYDRLLAQKREDALTIALGFDFQVVYALATDELDQGMDYLITEAAVYHPRLSQWTSGSEAETTGLAVEIAHAGLSQGGVIALHADLGVGKTIFVRGLSQAAQANEETASPTFVYCREYSGRFPIYHIDAYRVDEISPRDEEFWLELMQKPGVIAVEWAERLGTVLPMHAAHLIGEAAVGEERRWTLWTPLLSQASWHERKRV